MQKGTLASLESQPEQPPEHTSRLLVVSAECEAAHQTFGVLSTGHRFQFESAQWFSHCFTERDTSQLMQFNAIFIAWEQAMLPSILLARDLCRQSNILFIPFGGTEITESDQVAALVAGADDFFVLPVNPLLFAARFEALDRNRNRSAPKDAIHFSDQLNGRNQSNLEIRPAAKALRLDYFGQTIQIHQREINLTRTEFKLMQFFLDNQDRSVDRSDLLDAVWGIKHHTSTNVIDAMIYGLRKKLKQIGIDELLETVRGKGYRFVRCE